MEKKGQNCEFVLHNSEKKKCKSITFYVLNQWQKHASI